MIINKWKFIKSIGFFTLGLMVSYLMLSCLKAGDGVGLDPTGKVIPVNPCKTNPSGPGCVIIDSCKLSNPPARCSTVDSCKLPNAPARCAVIDSCTLANPPAHCVVTVDSCLRPANSTLRKPVSCLDSALFVSTVLPIFKNNCVGCHKTGGIGFSTTGLSLEPENAWNHLVNQPSDYVEGRDLVTVIRVIPGLPDSSYLYSKISSAKPFYYARMPLNTAALSNTDIQTIKTWITGKN
jgi:hypothetical protein